MVILPPAARPTDLPTLPTSTNLYQPLQKRTKRWERRGSTNLTNLPRAHAYARKATALSITRCSLCKVGKVGRLVEPLRGSGLRSTNLCAVVGRVAHRSVDAWRAPD